MNDKIHFNNWSVSQGDYQQGISYDGETVNDEQFYAMFKRKIAIINAFIVSGSFIGVLVYWTFFSR